MPDINFRAENKPLSDVLFSASFKYKVPRYQRLYTWTEDQVSDFWNDLINNQGPFFIGSLIFNYESYEDSGYIEIIDGQQRLLTITIFASVLRDLAKTLDEEISKRFQRQDIALEDRSGKYMFRILPGEFTKEFFETYIQTGNSDITKIEEKNLSPEQQKIKHNYEYFYEQIKKEIDKYTESEKKIAFLENLRKKISDLIVIHIKIDSEEDAYEIFETTNARGVDLSIADLLKNLIFKKIPTVKDQDFAKEAWNNITNNAQETNTELKKFIRYYWISKYPFVTEKKLFKEVKRKATDWTKLLEDLEESSDCFKKLIAGNKEDFQEYKHGERIYNSLFAIRLMDVSQCYVLFMSILRNYTKLKTDPVAIFEIVEKFTFLYSAICKLPGNKVERIYSKYALLLEEIIQNSNPKKVSANVQSMLESFKNELLKCTPTYEVFKQSFSGISYVNSEKSRRLIKYILNKINSIYRKTDEQLIDFDQVNIEHILPKNPDRSSKLRKKDIKEYVNKMGNLTIISTKLNSEAQNKTPKEKIGILEKSDLPINKPLVEKLKQSERWEEREINDRQFEFTDIVYNKVWHV
jgi:uncharacterized protein with ParB-like and HNH nuclease domain